MGAVRYLTIVTDGVLGRGAGAHLGQPVGGADLHLARATQLRLEPRHLPAAGQGVAWGAAAASELCVSLCQCVYANLGA